ncbi:MAG: glucuronate isomerase [Firmicutes bacterium]|nr:glucuronate isomerase [Bacillota bacterium]
MRTFMDEDFLLFTDTARRLFHQYAEDMPIIDYHCHIPPREIYEDRRFDDLTQVWLGGRNADGTVFGDHYKWRLMRANGASEDYVTGGMPPYERYLKFVEALEKAPGDPVYSWCCMELQRFFGFDEPLTLKTAKKAWDLASDKLRNDPDLSVRGIIKKSKVRMIGTTDDPADDLVWHDRIAEDPSFETKVYPSFRPDKAINIDKPGFAEYIGRLAQSVGKKSLNSAEDVRGALIERLEFFASRGCRASDHGLDYVPFRPAPVSEVEDVFKRAMAGEALSRDDADKYKTFILTALGRAYSRLGIAMQLHYSCSRNVNARMFRLLGPDSGYDMIGQESCGAQIAAFLSALDETGECPRTILYSLNGTDNDMLVSLAGCFQSGDIPGKIQLGSAWWFMDTRRGMEDQLRSFAQGGLLGNFVGMLTDSRSFLSYARHDYFRRIFCNLLGEWVENGEFPADEDVLKSIVRGVCYENAERYFRL